MAGKVTKVKPPRSRRLMLREGERVIVHGHECEVVDPGAGKYARVRRLYDRDHPRAFWAEKDPGSMTLAAESRG